MMVRQLEPSRRQYRVQSLLVSATVLFIGNYNLSAAEVKIFVLAGASNIYGQGFVAEANSPYDTPQDDVWIWQDDLGSNVGWTSLRPGFGATSDNFASGGIPSICNATQAAEDRCGKDEFGPELSLGRALADAFPGQQVAILKHARGGGDLVTHWNPGNAGAPDINHMYSGLTSKIIKAGQALHDDGLTYEVAGFFWEQGGADARDIIKAKAYEENLTKIINTFRDDFSDSEMPFVIGRKNIITLDRQEHLEEIRESQVAVAEADPFGAWIDIDDLSRRSPTDGHYNADGQIELGIRYANAFLEVSAVPEPSCLVLLTTAACSILLLRRRHSCSSCRSRPASGSIRGRTSLAS